MASEGPISAVAVTAAINKRKAFIQEHTECASTPWPFQAESRKVLAWRFVSALTVVRFVDGALWMDPTGR